MANGTLQFDGVDDYAVSAAFAFPERYTVFWDFDWLGSGNKMAGLTHPLNLYLYNYKASGSIRCFVKDASKAYDIPNARVGISTNGSVYAQDGGITPFGGVIGTGASPGYALSIARRVGVFTQMGFRQLLIFNKELSQAEVNDVLRVMFPA